jgi:hypothetical protein
MARLVLAFVLTVGATSCDGASSSSDAGGDGGELVWTPCHTGYECTTVEVPIDYDDPASETVGLRVLRASATGERRGVLLVNQGGAW